MNLKKIDCKRFKSIVDRVNKTTNHVDGGNECYRYK